MTVEQQIHEIELSIDVAKKGIDKRDALLRLTEHPDFKSVVREGYFEEEASRLVLLKADPSMQGAEDQKQIDNNITAIGYFRLYLHTVMQLGAQMEKSLKADEDTRQELLSEDL